MSRIWKVAAISTVSGVMPIPGFNLTADLDLLRAEIQLYRSQFGVTDQILEDSSNCPGESRLTEFSQLTETVFSIYSFYSDLKLESLQQNHSCNIEKSMKRIQ